MPRIFANDFNGLLLPLDARRVQQPYIFAGRNVIPAIDGVKSDFGAIELLARGETHDGMEDTAGATSINFANDETTYFCTRRGIFIFDAASNRLLPKFLLTTPVTTIAKWTFAEVNRVQFFARRDIGLISFDKRTGEWVQYSSDDLFPNIIACTEIGGRLFLVTGSVLAWSGIDLTFEESDVPATLALSNVVRSFITSTVTGAGFQSLALIRADDVDDVITCLPYEQGVITYTHSGFIRSELIDSTNPFRHRPVYRPQEMPLSDFAVTQFINNQHVYMTPRALFIHDGVNDPVPWQQLTSEYLRTLLERIAPARFGQIRLHYNALKGWLLVSVEEEEGGVAEYSVAYTYVVATDRWGICNRRHSGFHDFQFTPRRRSLAYTVESSRSLYQIQDINGVTTTAELSSDEFQQLIHSVGYASDQILEQLDGSYAWLEEMHTDFLYDAPTVPGIEARMQLGLGIFEIVNEHYTFYEKPLTALDSSCALGLFRSTEDVDIQEVTHFNEFVVGTDLQRREREDHRDWEKINTAAGDDLLVDFSNAEDNPAFRAEFGLTDITSRRINAESILETPVSAEYSVVSSLDGEYTRQGPASEAILDTPFGSPKASLYRVESYGLYHSVHVHCREPHQAFHIRTLELQVEPAGIHP